MSDVCEGTKKQKLTKQRSGVGDDLSTAAVTCTTQHQQLENASPSTSMSCEAVKKKSKRQL